MAPPRPHLKAGGEGPNLAASYGGFQRQAAKIKLRCQPEGVSPSSPPLTSRRAAKVQTSLPAMVISKAGGEDQTSLPAGGGSPYSSSLPQGGRRRSKLRCRLWHFKGRRRRPKLRCQPKEAGGEDQLRCRPEGGGQYSPSPPQGGRRRGKLRCRLWRFKGGRRGTSLPAEGRGHDPFLHTHKAGGEAYFAASRGGGRSPPSQARVTVSLPCGPRPSGRALSAAVATHGC